MAGSWNGTTYSGDDTNETVTGGAADEILFMWLGDDVANGGDGNDTIDGGLGNDQLYGGTGNDLLYDINSYQSGFSGLIGKDRVFGGDGDDTIWFNSVDGGDIANGGAGLDTLVVRFDFLGASTNLPITFALGTQTAVYVDGILGLSVSAIERVDFTASEGADILTGGKLGDTLRGMGGYDQLSGLAGDDLIDTGRGGFVADGGAGNDTLRVDLSDQAGVVVTFAGGGVSFNTGSITGSATGFEHIDLKGGAGDDLFTGDLNSDTLDGGTGADTLYGGGGDDRLVLGAGAGQAYGGAGNDTITYSNGAFDPADPGDGAYGGAGDDVIQLARGGNNLSHGGDGNDQILVAFDLTAAATSNTLWGDAGDDLVGGGYGADHLYGGAGNDVLSAYTRAAEVYGGSGNDRITINGSVTDPVGVGQKLDGGSGIDLLAWTGQLGGTVNLTGGAYVTASGSTWTGFEAFSLYVGLTSALNLTFGAGNDKLTTAYGSFAVTAQLGKGDDTASIYSGAAVDLNGGAGNDVLTVNSASSARIVGGDGNDVMAYLGNGTGGSFNGGAGVDGMRFGTAVAASLVTHLAVRGGGTDTLAGIENLTGSSQNDTLVGDKGDNQLFSGGFGNDVITTGAGNDTVLLTYYQSGETHVTDFNRLTDQIGLAKFDFGAMTLPRGALEASHVVFGPITGTPVATILGPQFFYDKTSGALWMDADGTATGQAMKKVMVFDNHPTLTIADFTVGDYLF